MNGSSRTILTWLAGILVGALVGGMSWVAGGPNEKEVREVPPSPPRSLERQPGASENELEQDITDGEPDQS